MPYRTIDEKSHVNSEATSVPQFAQPGTAHHIIERRVEFLAGYLEQQLPLHGLNVLDYGCDLGNAMSELREKLRARQVFGVDGSAEAIEVALRCNNSKFYQYSCDGASIESESLDVVYAVNALRRIEPPQRVSELCKLLQWVKPGGYIALFERNPRNPKVKRVMRREVAQGLPQYVTATEARKLLHQSGFDYQVTRSLFFFPELLSFLRPLSSMLAPLPFAAEYVVIAKRPRS